MFLRVSIAIIIIAMAGAAAAQNVTKPHAGPISIYCRPDGQGRTLAEAWSADGFSVDGTLTVTVTSTDFYDFGEPLPGVPAEDIWLGTPAGTLFVCQAMVPDGPSDSAGQTTFHGPFAVGGSVAPGVPLPLTLYVFGNPQEPITDVGCNSPDLNGDGRVDLSDAGDMSGLLQGAYAYRGDFNWDGVINVSDAGFFAVALGVSCP